MTRGHYSTQRPTGRGYYGKARSAHVGISLYHSVGDREKATEQVNTAMVTLVSELIGKMGADPRAMVVDFGEFSRDPKGYVARRQNEFAKMQASPLYPIYRDTVAPTYSEWNAFYADQSDWDRFKTDWETYENWQERVVALRAAVDAALARNGADQLQSVNPSSLPTTLPGTIIDTTGDVIKTVGKGAKKAADDTWSMVRIAVYGALGLAGVIAVSSIVQQLRKDRDPLESYAAIARARSLPMVTALARRGR